MSRKIGEALVQRGIITEDQLKIALNLQLVRGGHLGTCLVELSYADVEQFGQVLSEILGVGCATADMFSNIPELVIASVPLHLVEKHRVVPFRFADKVMHVAMIKPRDLQAIDDLEFATSCRIEPWVAPEVSVLRAMEIYYGIPRSRRFIILSPVRNRPAADRSSARTEEASPGRGNVAAEALAAVSAGAPPVDGVDLGAVVEYGTRWTEIVGTLDAEVSRRETEQLHDAEDAGTSSMDRVSDRLCAADTPEEVANAVLDNAMLSMPRCVIFLVDTLVARIWAASGFGQISEGAKKAMFTVTQEPLFELLAGNEHYHGPVPENVRYHRFYEELDSAIPEQILLLPIYLRDRLAAVFYGDSGDGGSIRGRIEDHSRMMAKTGIAFRILGLKQQLRGS